VGRGRDAGGDEEVVVLVGSYGSGGIRPCGKSQQSEAASLGDLGGRA